jgi:hypothetical protein
VAVELNNRELTRLRASGTHAYAAINRAVERLELTPCVFRTNSSHREMVANS